MSMISKLVEELIDNADLYTKELHDLMYRAEDTIERLSEKVRGQEWIPCSERLPDKNGWYLLAQAFEWGIEYEAGVWEDGAWWINDNSHVTVAWKPIEPYKEKNDE